MSVLVTYVYGGYTVKLETKSGVRRVAGVITEALNALFVQEDASRVDNIKALLVDNKIYRIEEDISLQNTDVVVLLAKVPVTTPIPPTQSESKSVSVYEKNLIEEGINLSDQASATKIGQLLRKNTIFISEDDLAKFRLVFPFPDLLADLLKPSKKTDDTRQQYSKLLRKCGKILLKKQKHFLMERIEFLWHVHLVMPLLNKCSFHEMMSGETKLAGQYALLARHSETRKLFSNGIIPDLCNGWLFKLAVNKQKNDDYILQTPFGEAICLDQIPSLDVECGDGNILLLDLFVEVKWGGQPGHADRAKLHLEMGQAARIFAARINQYPIIFGLTFDAEIVNGYAAQLDQSGTSAAATWKEIAKNSSSMSSSSSTQRKDFDAMKRPNLQSKDSKESKGSQQSKDSKGSNQSQSKNSKGSNQSQSKESKEIRAFVPSVTIEHLWTLNLNDPTHSVLLAGHLAQIRELRLQQFNRWRDSVNDLPFKKPEQKQAQTFNNTNKTKDDSDSSGNDDDRDDDDDYDEGDDDSDGNDNKRSTAPKEFISLCSKYGFMPRDASNLSGGEATIVYRGWLIEEGTPAVFKAFDNFDHYFAEHGIYEHLQHLRFTHMPKMLKWHCSNELDFIITEDLGNDKLKLETKEDVKMFAFDLLKAVDALHNFRVLHSDLKLSNLRYLKKERMVKLFDFSFSSIFKRLWPTTMCLGYTTGYASPEALVSDEITPAHDMFSVGMILASLVFDFKPENDDDYKWVCAQIESNEAVPLADPPMLELIGQLLKSDHTERLSAQKALEAHLFSNESTSGR